MRNRSLQGWVLGWAWALVCTPGLAEVTGIEITGREQLAAPGVPYHYEVISGRLHFTLDPQDPHNAQVVDLALAPRNDTGRVAFSTDFRLVLPSAEHANGSLVYLVNNRGSGRVAPERDLADPLAAAGFTWLLTGWINELQSGDNRLVLDAPVVGSPANPVRGSVRYEMITGTPAEELSVTDRNHLAYAPSATGAQQATLTRRENQTDSREPIPRDRFHLRVVPVAGRSQPDVFVRLEGGFDPGVIYELIYEAENPVLAGSGLAGIRDAVSLLRYGTDSPALAAQLGELALPTIRHAIAIGNSQSGRLLRQYLYDGFNADLQGRAVFDGVIPVIAGAGMGMFNMRFAMPTRTNGQHENQRFPNDLFPFTYGDSVDPFSGRADGILRRARVAGVEPRVMHIQTANEYWIRAGSLVHTDPSGTQDAELPAGVRVYAIGGSQHGSGDGRPRPASGGQLPPNPNRWQPIADALLVAMHRWVSEGVEPPPSRYPRIADGTLVPSHLADGQINPRAWHPLPGVAHPKAMYQVELADWGPQWREARVVTQQPTVALGAYGARVPAVDSDNNDLAGSTVLPPMTQVPLATFVPWNLRAVATGAPTELARLSGGYLPFASKADPAADRGDPRPPIAARYRDFAAYRAAYEQATDDLIDAGFLLPGHKADYMAIADFNRNLFP